MVQLVLFLLPGFCALIVSFARKNLRNIDPNQWVILLAIGANSVIAFVTSFLLNSLLFYSLRIFGTNLPSRCFELLDKSISIHEYVIALIVGALLPILEINLFGILQPKTSIQNMLVNNEDELIMLTLDDGKIYVGTLHGFDTYAGAELNSIRIYPFFSGHRDKADGKLHVTTSYIELDPADEVKMINSQQVDVGILVKRIISIRNFAMDHFLYYIDQNTVSIDDTNLAKIFVRIKQHKQVFNQVVS